jgi:hypothetical protein
VHHQTGLPDAFVKKSPKNVAQSIFFENQYTFIVDKSSPIICAISVIFTTMPKIMSHPMG